MQPTIDEIIQNMRTLPVNEIRKRLERLYKGMKSLNIGKATESLKVIHELFKPRVNTRAEGGMSMARHDFEGPWQGLCNHCKLIYTEGNHNVTVAGA